jgi:ABC-type transport system involved in cytochrome c biogenesis permease subunit
MIQRKQTIWLLLAIISMVATIYLPFGYQAHAAPNASSVLTISLKANYNFITIVLIAITIAIAGFSIFLFKKRNLQKGLSALGILTSIGLTVYEFFIANDKINNYVITFGIVLPIVAGILFLMAWFGINADEKLIKSVDRLRD